jgi:shikimate dehydrogenase
MPDRYAVIGNPVKHSKSPRIHEEFARQTKQDIVYTTLDCELNGFSEKVDEFFFRDGGKGLNVTVPFKNEAFRKVTPGDISFGGVVDAEAVNTIKLVDGKLFGYNTDGIGLVTDIEQNLRFPIKNKRVLLMGAGGATQGVMHPVLEQRPDLLVVANRTMDKAIRIVRQFQKFENFTVHGIEASPYPDLAGRQFDLIINATSAGLSGTMPPLPEGLFAPGALAYDMVYGRDTPFLAFARRHGARAADGLGMLVEQAAESFFIWRDVRPQTAPVIEKLRDAS